MQERNRIRIGAALGAASLTAAVFLGWDPMVECLGDALQHAYGALSSEGQVKVRFFARWIFPGLSYGLIPGLILLLNAWRRSKGACAGTVESSSGWLRP